MDTAVDVPVKLGLYYNHVTRRWLWLLPQTAAGIAVQFLGIWLTLALPRVWVALHVLYREGVSIRGREVAAAAALNQDTFELRDDAAREQVPDAGAFALERVRNAGLPRNRLSTDVLPRRDGGMAVHDLTLAFFGALFFVFVIVSGTLTNLLAGDSVALAHSAGCGYLPPDNWPLTQQSMTEQNRIDEVSASYARECYDGRGSAVKGCNLFAVQALPYSVESETDCPYEEEICLLGRKGAIKFTTGPLSVQTLGLNSARAVQFQRTTICAPLVRDHRYVGTITSNDTDLLPDSSSMYTYWYGKCRDPQAQMNLNFTYGTIVGPEVGISHVYKLGTMSEINGVEEFRPIHQLRFSEGGRLTLLFIDNSGVRYVTRVDDVIFEAQHLSELELGNTNLNSYTVGLDLRPKVLACTDAAYIRDRRLGEAWMAVPMESRADDQDWPLVRAALNVSNIYHVVFLRRASALQASSMSVPGAWWSFIGPDQWKVEAQQMFETSLARAQFEARNIALGIYSTMKGYVKDENSESLCREEFLMNAPGYRNVNAAAWLAIFLVSLLIIVGAFPTGSKEQEKLLFEHLPTPIVHGLARTCAATAHAISTGLDSIVTVLIQGYVTCASAVSIGAANLRDWTRSAARRIKLSNSNSRTVSEWFRWTWHALASARSSDRRPS